MFGKMLDAVMIPHTANVSVYGANQYPAACCEFTQKNTGTEEKTRKGEIGSTANEIPRITSWVAGCTLRDYMCNGNFREKPSEGDIYDLFYGSAGLVKSNGGVAGDW
jgi:hypothetical protein